MKLFLIDGHALIFKMYYAFLGRPMVNSKDEDTSILFGFTKYLLELIDKEQPSHIAVSFDPPGGCFRCELYPEYKANRAETPQLIIDALKPLTEIVQAMRIPVLMIPGFEADDVIGSAAKLYASSDVDVYMVTPDKDYGQLVGKHIFQYKPGKSGSDNEILGPSEVCQKWKIADTAQVIDILALCGDSSDNVPGVQGVGPVGAAKLLAKYGSVENIYEHISELTARQQEMFRAAQGHIQLSKTLVTIKTDIAIEHSLADMVLDMEYSSELERLLDHYEFPSLKRLVRKITGEQRPLRSEELQAPQTVLHAEELPASLLKADRVAFNYKDGIMHAAAGKRYAKGNPLEFKALLEDERVVKAGVDLKSQMRVLHELGIELKGRIEDIELMHYVLNPERSHKLEMLAKSYLGVNLEEEQELSSASLFDDVPESPGADRKKETLAILALSDALNKELDASADLRKLYDSIEEPLVKVLSAMEIEGVYVDLDSLKDFADTLREQMLLREKEIKEIAADPMLNVASPKQLGYVIYEKLKLNPKARKPKSGNWPTDEQTLQELSDKSPIIEAILDYRGLRKLLSTYIEPFASYVSARDGRVHTSFNQALTATGRLSSSNPNLQNIPIRSDRGREIRRAFVASSEGSVMMSADYSQIELRLMAHFCQDEHLIEAFNSSLDVHSATASKIFHIPLEEVTAEQRRVAKTVNFGIMYGMSAFGLSQRLHCSRQEAKRFIDDYFASFPSIRNFIDQTIAYARDKGYVQTLFGRRRYISDISSGNAVVRSLAERNAVNAPIQGSAADIIKLAMIAVAKRMRDENLKSALVLQIHDELLLEVSVDEIDKVRNILVSEMENVVRLSVPLTVECNYGKTWLDAH